MNIKNIFIKEILKDMFSVILIYLFSDYIFSDTGNRNTFLLAVIFFYVIHYIFFIKGERVLNEKYKKIKLFIMPIVVFSAIGLIIFKAYVMNDGPSLVLMLEQNLFVGKIIYFTLCLVTPYIILMSEPFTIMTGSTVFSNFWAFILGYIGVMGGILSLFMLIRKKGNKYIKKFIKEKELEKYRKFVAKNEGLYLTILFVFPILPDGVICGGAGLSEIKWKKFFIIAIVSKLFTVGIYTFFVDWIQKSKIPINIWSMLAGIGIIYLVYKKYKRRKNLR